MWTQDYVLNGQVHGQFQDRVAGMKFQPGLLRPYLVSERGREIPYVTLNVGYNGDGSPKYKAIRVSELQARGVNSPVFNATSLRKEEWIQLDTTVLKAARYRLRLWSDISAVSSFGGFNGMSKMILEHETMSDPGEAQVDMDGLSEGTRNDAPKYQLEGLPLPITHVDFYFSARTLAISRNTGTPLDTTMGEAAGRRIAETIEKTTIGNQTGVTYGGASTYVGGYGRTSAVYGLVNFPSRNTSTSLYAGTHASWTPEQTQKQFNTALNTLRADKFYGPFMVYHSTDWDPYLDGDYYAYVSSGAVAPTKTLRNRLREIDGIQDVRRLDMLFSSVPAATTGPGRENVSAAYAWTMVFVQMTPDVIRAVNGMDITTVQWETRGGMQLNFKVMAIQVPQIRADFYGNCGILHLSGQTQ